MKRKKYLISLLFLTIMLYLQGCGKIELSPKDVQIELGAAVSDSVLDYIETEQRNEIKEVAELDTSAIDSMVVGEYEAEVFYKDQTISIPVSVVDTTPPIIQNIDTEFNEDDKVRVKDLVQTVDFAPTTVDILSNFGGVELYYTILKPNQKVVIRAVDESGNETITEIMPKVIAKEKERLCPERCYESLADFPYGNLEYINDETYAVLKQLYEEIDWNPDFEEGDISEYPIYKQKYKALLDGKTTFQIIEKYASGEEVKEESLSTFLDLDSNYDPITTFDGGAFRYGLLFFDIDVDGAPELCITEKAVETCVRCTYIFKYKKSENKIILWQTIYGTSTQIIGSNTVATYWEDRQFNLEKLGTDGEPLISVQFANEFFYANGEECFLAAVPVYADDEKDTISDEMKMQGYYDELGELYYFYLTEGQYHELTDEFFDVFIELAPKKRQEVTFTYEELFGNV